MTLLLEPPRRTRARAVEERPQHILLEDVSWKYYLKTLDELEGSRRYRVTYDDGRMEIMVPAIVPLHEYGKTSIARLLETYAFLNDINITVMGQVTTIREDVKKGVEPNECYWVQSKPPPIEHQRWLDLGSAARPDLVVEVDITSAMIEREPIYAAFGVPEIWRFRVPRIEVLRLDPKTKTYRAAGQSKVFPKLPIDKFNELLARALKGDQHGAVMALRRWLKPRRK